MCIFLAELCSYPYSAPTMFAVVTIAGFQEMVQEGDVIRVPKLNAEPGEKVTFNEVLLISDGKDATIGSPMIDGASVEVKVTSHGRDKKIRVFKMLRRKRFRRTHGHRTHFTEIEIIKINGKAPAKKTTTKKEAKPAAKVADKK